MPGRHAARHAAGRSRPGRHARRTRTPRRALALAVVPAVLASGTAAYAYWSASGSGTATVGTATAAPLTVASAGTALAALHPGRQVDVGLRVTNPNAYPVQLTKLTALSITSSDEAACPAGTHLSVSSTVMTGIAGGGYVLPTAIAVGSGATADATLPQLVTMKTTAPDACQGRTFTLSLSLTGEQSG